MLPRHFGSLWVGSLAVTLLAGCGADEPTESATSQLPIIIPPPGGMIPLPQAQQRCAETWSSSVATNLGAWEFDKDLRFSGDNYGLNARYRWPLHVSSNVRWMNPHTSSWNSVVGDYLMFNSGKIEGNQGTNWWGSKYGPNSAAYIPVEWKSDGADTLPGFPKVDKVRFQCRPDSEQTGLGPIRPIGVNERNDGVFFNADDIMYFSVTQPADRALLVTLDVNAASTGADFDLFASATIQRPSARDYTWGDISGSSDVNDAGGAVFIDSTGAARTIYIGVGNSAGTGHVSLRANAVETRTLTICTQDMSPSVVHGHPGYANVDETIRRTVLRILQLTNGNLFFDRVKWKTQSSGIRTWDVNRKFCDDDASCDWCMTAYGLPPEKDGCGYQSQGATGKMRVPNVRCQGSEADSAHVGWDAQRNLSHKLAHEAGHALARLYTHNNVGTLLKDQYVDDFHAATAHTIMNGPLPAGQLDTSYRFSTDYDHCKVNDPQASPVCPPKSDWRTIQDSGFFPSTWIYPSHSFSAQPWLKLFDNRWAGTQIWVE